jgi:hypothetical protein
VLSGLSKASRRVDEHARFANVADFLEAVPAWCPYDLFQGSARASESAPAFLDRSRLAARQKENFATRLAQRHPVGGG